MNFRKTGGRRRVSAAFDLNNLIDVVLQLVFFFMLSSTFIDRTSLQVNLPEAAGASQGEQTSMTVTISPDGAVSVNRDPVNNTPLEQPRVVDDTQLTELLTQFHAANPKEPVVIQADEAVATGRTVGVMGLIYSAGITNMMVAAESPEGAT